MSARCSLIVDLDCVSLKPNSTSILVQNLICNGTHGVSVGSLGQYASRVDYVENVLVRNISMYNSSEGARIKVWPDAYSEKSISLTGGGGRGLVRNVTFDGMFLDNVDYGLTITQCYGQDDEEECFRHPVSSLSFPRHFTAHPCRLVFLCKANPTLTQVQTQYNKHKLSQHPRPHEPGLQSHSRSPRLLESRYLLQHRRRKYRY